MAADFAKALGVNRKGEGCFRNQHTIITWAVGHLVELCEPDAYDPALKKWRMDLLPMIPNQFRYRPIKQTYQQFKTIKSLLKSPDIDRVIVATDAGREGEVIARTILLESGFTDKSRIFRFWTSQALVPEVVRNTMKQLSPITDYDRLWRAGYYRQVADWLVGMNCTRMVTLRLGGDLFSVGRVQTAVLAFIADRKKERDNFVPETYWLIKGHFSNEKGEWTGQWFKGKESQLKKKEEVEALCDHLRNHPEPGVVISAKKEQKSEPPPFLFSLTDLQQEANRRFGFPAKKTLNIAQALYQGKKCLSYPRTDSRVLGTQNLDMVKSIIEKFRKTSPERHGTMPPNDLNPSAYPADGTSSTDSTHASSSIHRTDRIPSPSELFIGIDPKKLSLSNKRVFNDAKLTDHHALIPFKPLPSGSSSDEKKIFDLVLRRFAAAFYPHCQFENTHIVTQLAEETFQTKGKVILIPGWRAIYGETPSPQQRSHHYSAPLTAQPDQGDIAKGQQTMEKHQRISPKGGIKKRGGQKEEMALLPPLVKGDSAIAQKIIPEEKQTIPPPDYTDALILKDMTNPGKYVDEDEIKQLYRGDTGIGTQATRAQIIETLLSRQYVTRSGKKIIATEKGTFLVDMLRKCPVTSVLTSPEETARWEMRLNHIALGETEHDPTVPSFLTSIKAFVKQSVNELKQVAFEENPIKSFQPEAPPSTVIGACPVCKGPVRENRKAFSCATPGCDFVIWKKIAGKVLSPGMASNLLKFKKSGPYKGFISKKKKKFSAALLLHQKEGKWQVSFDFDQEKSNKSVITEKRPKIIDSSNEGTVRSPNEGGLFCPLCGGNIIEGKKGYGCENWHPSKGDCKFVIWKEIMEKKLTKANIETLIEGKSTRPYVLKNERGEKFKGKLKMSKRANGEWIIAISADEASLPPSYSGNNAYQFIIPCTRD